MTTLEQQITNETCIHKIKAMQMAYLNEEEIKHRNCSGLNYQCENYKPVKNTGERFSHLNLYKR